MRLFRSLILLSGCMAFLLSACTRKEEVRPVGDGNNTYTITASFADGQAKASVGADGSCSWTAGDKIAVFDAVSGSFCEFETETGDGVFSFTGTPGTPYQFTHAYYPASIARDAMTVALPEAYTASQVQTASAFPAAGTVEGNTIQFRHLATAASAPRQWLLSPQPRTRRWRPDATAHKAPGSRGAIRRRRTLPQSTAMRPD